MHKVSASNLSFPWVNEIYIAVTAVYFALFVSSNPSLCLFVVFVCALSEWGSSCVHTRLFNFAGKWSKVRCCCVLCIHPPPYRRVTECSSGYARGVDLFRAKREKRYNTTPDFCLVYLSLHLHFSFFCVATDFPPW